MANRFNGFIAFGGKLTREQITKCSSVLDLSIGYELNEHEGKAEFNDCAGDDFNDIVKYCEEQKIAVMVQWYGTADQGAQCEYWVDGKYKQFETDASDRIVVTVADLEEHPHQFVADFVDSLGIPKFPEFSIVEEEVASKLIYHNSHFSIKLPIVDGKNYVLDTFSGPIAGPFDTLEQAQQVRSGMGIEEDCEIGECKAIDKDARKYILCGYRFRADVEECEYCGGQCTDENGCDAHTSEGESTLPTSKQRYLTPAGVECTILRENEHHITLMIDDFAGKDSYEWTTDRANFEKRYQLLRSVTVYFSDGKASTNSTIGDDDDIAKHFLGKEFESGSNSVALCVQFNDTNETLGLQVKNIESGDRGTIRCVRIENVKVDDNKSYEEIMLDLLDGNVFAIKDVWIYDMQGDWLKTVGYPHETVRS